MKVTLDIKDSKAAAFLNFVKSLDFIRIHRILRNLASRKFWKVSGRV